MILYSYRWQFILQIFLLWSAMHSVPDPRSSGLKRAFDKVQCNFEVCGWHYSSHNDQNVQTLSNAFGWSLSIWHQVESTKSHKGRITRKLDLLKNFMGYWIARVRNGYLTSMEPSTCQMTHCNPLLGENLRKSIWSETLCDKYLLANWACFLVGAVSVTE